MKKTVFITAVSLLTAALLVYSLLGGFTSLTYETVTIPEIRVWGEEFTGRPTQKELEDLFYKYRDLAIEKGQPLIVITYPKTEETAEIRQFIGLREKTADSLQSRSWPAGKFVRVILSLNPMVTPKPEKVYEKAAEHASEAGLELSGESIEIYSQNADTEVLFPVQNGD